MEFERGMDNKDIAKVELTGCQGREGEEPDGCQFCSLSTRRAMVSSSAIIMDSSAFPAKQGISWGCRGCGGAFLSTNCGSLPTAGPEQGPGHISRMRQGMDRGVK